MSDDDSFASRRRRRRRQSTEEEEDNDPFGLNSNGGDDAPTSTPAPPPKADSDEEEEESDEEEDEDDEAPAPTRQATRQIVKLEAGTTIGKLMEAKRKKFQQNLIDGLFKLAEKKYGQKRPQRSGDAKANAMEDYDLYLRSVKAKVKTSQDKLSSVQKQKKDIDAKFAQAEKELSQQQSKLDKAEEEKNNAINESRDPELPKDFIVPQRAKKANAGLGALVMKASGGKWEEKFAAMKTTKANTSTPEWMAKQKKTDKTSALLKIGKAATEKKAPRRRRKDDDDKPNPFTVGLKKTGLRKEETDNGK